MPFQCEFNNCHAMAEKTVLLDLQDYQIELNLCGSCLKQLGYEK